MPGTRAAQTGHWPLSCASAEGGRMSRRMAFVFAITVACGMTVGGAVARASARPAGVGKPPPGSGIGTAAAMNNPQCNRDAGPYGRFNFVFDGSGGVCVVPFEKGSKNGGATAQGVTKDPVTLAVVTQDP